MRIFIITFLALSIIMSACRKDERKADTRSVKTSAVATVANKGDFIPFSWQTKWFNKDLNSRLHLRGQDGC